MSAPDLRLALEQFAPRLREPTLNLQRIVRTAGDADLVLTPELSLTGYDVGDAVHRLALPIEPNAPLPHGPCDTAAVLVLGAIEQGREAVPYNTAVVVEHGQVTFKHRKLYLPTYGMFDEARFFGRGDTIAPFELRGWRIGLLVCEDFWHPGLTYALAAAGIDVLLVQAAGPGRGVRESATGEMMFASSAAWDDIARTTALLYGIYVGLCNRIGVEGAVTFAGGSLVVGPDGAVITRAGAGEARLEVELQHAQLARARRPGAHFRDDDPRLVRRALERLAPG